MTFGRPLPATCACDHWSTMTVVGQTRRYPTARAGALTKMTAAEATAAKNCVNVGDCTDSWAVRSAGTMNADSTGNICVVCASVARTAIFTDDPITWKVLPRAYQS